MKKRLAFTIVLILTVLLGFLIGFQNGKEAKNPISGNKDKTIYIGETNISDYVIVGWLGATSSANSLKKYIHEESGQKLPVRLASSNDKTITVKLSTPKNSGIFIQDGKITIAGTSPSDCQNKVNEFANTYLGWAFAGSDRVHILSGNDVIHIPTSILSGKDSWMEEREPIICLWKTNVPRGQFYNTNASLASEVLSYSDDQLYDYVRMMKYCGFTGIQVTDMCSSWAQYGGYEFVQQRIRFMADAAHSLGMNFTLWVWGAEFNGYGWIDNSVVYHDPSDLSKLAYEYEPAIDTFEKYYSIYAELADCSDKVIAHFDDPTNIRHTKEIAYFSGMLRDKFKAINPNIKFGVSDYTDKYDKAYLKEYLGDDFFTLCGAYTYNTRSWINFRTVTRDQNIYLGIWSWNLGENEIDQLSQMNVNTKVIKEVYNRTAGEDWVKKPFYWSEMDSYHVLNIFSLYSEGQLLINPELDADEILREISAATVGENYADDFYEILDIIQDARAGETFEEFRWGTESYLLTSDNYPAEDIYERCEKYYPILEEMIEANLNENTVPLPVSTTELLRLIKSHMKQIMTFSKFRIDLAEVINDYNAGNLSADSTARQLEKIYQPVPNYDTVAGVWGSPEAIAQVKLLSNFCQEADIKMPKASVYNYYRKTYVYEEIIALQKNQNTKLIVGNNGGTLWSVVFGENEATRIVDELVSDGLLVRTTNGVYLTNWEEYTFINH